jgi:hypothetical protein
MTGRTDIGGYSLDDVLRPALWRRTQADLATLSDDGLEIEALRPHHFVQTDDPKAVIAAVGAVVDAARAQTPPGPCARSSRLRRAGSLI